MLTPSSAIRSEWKLYAKPFVGASMVSKVNVCVKERRSIQPTKGYAPLIGYSYGLYPPGDPFGVL